MKILSNHIDENHLIKKAMKGDPLAQKLLYNKFAPKMLGVCRQYIKDMHYAEDTMITGFVKVFSHLDRFEYRGSFEGWIRKIMVRECISFLRKRKFVEYDDEQIDKNTSIRSNETGLELEEIQLLIDGLPDGYRTVFLLYIVEGYKHQEIAKMLQISESTSKTQLFRARKIVQEKLRAQNIIGYGTN
ncbi:RNA polymerase sigma factor [Flavobacteriaceae bacterium F08102]|nr:RNA polymerase sigma factor [Flavobacteriaceae bacterium F08102]